MSEPITAQNLLEVLSQADAHIAYAEEQVEAARYQRDMAKIELQVAEADAILNNQDAKNQSILNALVAKDEQVRLWKKTLTSAERNLNAAQREYSRQENRFTAARKIASMDAELSTYRQPNA